MAPAGLVIAAAGIILLVVLFDLSAIASIGSAVALGIFALVTIGHLRIRAETGRAPASCSCSRSSPTGVTLLTFVFTTLIQEPALDPHARGDRRPQHRARPVVGPRSGATRRGGSDRPSATG